MISFEQVDKTFGQLVALDQVSFEMEKGELVFLVGQTGAGKSTLFKLLLKCYSPSGGRIVVDEVDLNEIKSNKVHLYRRKIGVVFQDFRLLPNQNVLENVSLPLRIAKTDPELIEKEAEEALELVGLRDRLQAFPAQLSGGEIQRVALARSVVANPEIILADEPTGNLDIEAARDLVGLLKKVNQLGKTIIIATHNFDVVNEFKERVLCLKNGKLVSDEKNGKYRLK